MSNTLIRLIILFLLCISAPAGADEDAKNKRIAPEDIAKVIIMTQHCEESLAKLMAEMVKYYINQEDFDSAEALIQVAKNSRITGTDALINVLRTKVLRTKVLQTKVLQTKSTKDPHTYGFIHLWIFGQF